MPVLGKSTGTGWYKGGTEGQKVQSFRGFNLCQYVLVHGGLRGGREMGRVSSMVHDIFAAAELYIRLRAKVRDAYAPGVSYADLAHARNSGSNERAAPPEAQVLPYLDPLWALERCLGRVEETLGRGYPMWAAARLLGASDAREAWALWQTVPKAERPALPSYQVARDGWETLMRTGDLVFDRELGRAGLLA